ncbi:MAG TPA: heavy metal-associated domain-containing protein [Bacillales bacterium]|nr:heavy metal-associated domain-containing protein [Bacillales bacterium]
MMMSSIQLALNDIACSSCIMKIKKEIRKKHGIEKVKIIKGSGNLHIDFNENVINEEEVRHLVNQMAVRMFD